jgi:hypothetical protein
LGGDGQTRRSAASQKRRRPRVVAVDEDGSLVHFQIGVALEHFPLQSSQSGQPGGPSVTKRNGFVSIYMSDAPRYVKSRQGAAARKPPHGYESLKSKWS